MEVGLIGFTGSGKSALYRSAAGGHPKGDLTAVPVKDERFHKIVEQVKPKKVTPATVVLHDNFGSFQRHSTKKLSQNTIDSMRKAELLLHVVQAFDALEQDAVKDQKAVEEELILLDLQIVENRLERLKKSLQAKSPGTTEYLEKVLFEKLMEPLSEGKALRELSLESEDLLLLKNYQFLSAKPMIVAFNVAEDSIGSSSSEILNFIYSLQQKGIPGFVVCATLEEEVVQLDPADQPEFLASLGLTEPASAKVIRAVYDALGWITFYTAGENDTRAWPLPKGSTAVEAAGVIHTDIAKGFIRAEIVHYADWLESGSLDAAYHSGKMHLEGKDYVIQDGDLLHIRNKS